MSLRNRHLRLALWKTLSDAFVNALKDAREDHEQILFREYEETGTRSWDVLLPGTAGKAGTVVLTGPSERTEVEDAGALLAWAKESMPSLVREVVVPPQPEMRFMDFEPGAKSGLLKSLVWDEDAQVMVHKVTGEVVPGVTFRPAGKPTGFQIRVTPEGKEQLLQALDAGWIDPSRLLAADPEPREIGWADDDADRSFTTHPGWDDL